MIRNTGTFAETSARADEAFRIAAKRVVRISEVTDTPILTWDDKTGSIVKSSTTSHAAKDDGVGKDSS